MKKLAAPLALLFAASVLHAEAPAPAAATTAPAATVPAVNIKSADDKTVTGKPGVTTKTLKPAALPKIPGMEIPRPNGTLLGLEVVGSQFKLSFYDKKHKLMAVDVTRATARWPNTRSSVKAWNRSVLNGSGTYLYGSTPVLPPLIFNVHLTLLKGDGDEAKAVEEYDVAFRG